MRSEPERRPTPRAGSVESVLRTAHAVRPAATPSQSGRRRILSVVLVAAGIALVAIALAQAAGAHFGLLTPMGAEGGTHLMNESTALTVGLGVAVVAAGVWRPALPGVALVLVAATVTLAAYVVHDLIGGEVTLERVATHIPLVLATVLAAALWFDDHREPRRGSGPGGIQRPENADDRRNYAA